LAACLVRLATSKDIPFRFIPLLHLLISFYAKTPSNRAHGILVIQLPGLINPNNLILYSFIEPAIHFFMPTPFIHGEDQQIHTYRQFQDIAPQRSPTKRLYCIVYNNNQIKIAPRSPIITGKGTKITYFLNIRPRIYRFLYPVGEYIKYLLPFGPF